MSEKYLNRGDAPFDQKVWDALDSAVIGAARGQLSGRKLLKVEGPWGLGLRSIPMQERTVREDRGAGSSVTVSTPWPLAYLSVEFRIPVREIASFETQGLPLNLRPAVNAALEIARLEDDLIFNGDEEMHVNGLLNVPGRQTVGVSGWEHVGTAADSVIAAITVLDRAGFPGPYTLALTPELHNLLLRKYPQGNMTELEHLGVMVSQGIFKAPSLVSGGILLASGPQYASLVVGQDIMVGYIGPEGGGYSFTVSGSIFLRINVPEALCILTV